jgi:hypothetical protein
MDLPIVCTLTDQQLRERRLNVFEPLRDRSVQSEELIDGYAFTFQPQDGLLLQLSQLVELESECCRFLTFKIVADSQTIRLEVTGPQAAKRMIADLFALSP